MSRRSSPGMRNFNPLPSCEGRLLHVINAIFNILFQSTPLMRGETDLHPEEGDEAIFQSTPLIRGETGACADYAQVRTISIHSPHARGDEDFYCDDVEIITFQSTPLMRGETRRAFPGDGRAADFNPLPSCEGRLLSTQSCILSRQFQSTPLMRGETKSYSGTVLPASISIHSPHARGDVNRSLAGVN